MEGDDAGPVGPLLEDELVPGLGLRAHVDEDQRRRRALDLLDHRQLHLLAEVSAPREAARAVGQEGVDDQVLLDPAAHDEALLVAEEDVHCLVEIAERRRQAPDDQPRVPALQARERELHLDAALVAHQLVPLVDDHRVDAGELLARAFARQHQAQRFGRRHERARKAPVLLGALGRRRVAGADADRPGDVEVVERCAHRPCRIGGEGAHRRQPEDAERGRRTGAIGCRQRAEGTRALKGAEPDRVGLARAGGRVQQAALSLGHRNPDLALERERPPVARGEPRVGDRVERRRLRRRCQRQGAHRSRPRFLRRS